MARRRTFFFDGLGVSAGICIGPALLHDTGPDLAESYAIHPADVEREIARFDEALKAAHAEVAAMGQLVAERIDRQQAAIFDAHRLMLDDPYVVDTTRRRIREELVNAESVFWGVIKSVGEQFKALKDEYFSERSHDLYEVGRRVLKFLRKHGGEENKTVRYEGCIVVADQLGPGEITQLANEKVIGVCTNIGGPTSHTAIMAKALGLPAVVGLDYITQHVRTGDLIILDGAEGKVILNPTAEQLDFYRAQLKQYSDTLRVLESIRELPADTADGCHISLEANIDYFEHLDTFDLHGAEGAGLCRTESLFLHREAVPTEDEQIAAYRAVIDLLGDRPVTFRVLDLGGDKLGGLLATPAEENPFLGLRGIRLCLTYPELLRSQLRAMMLAAQGRELRIMIPMVGTAEEIRLVKRYINEILERLRREGKPTPSRIHTGIMVEIPSAAILADELARESDFFSIGTNDLVQYTLAVDRINKSVAYLYQANHPAVLRLVDIVVRAAGRRDIPVSVCGEMASVPEQALLLVGLGVRRLSMGPGSISAVKKAIRSVTIAEAQSVATAALAMTTAEEVTTRLRNWSREVLGHLQNTEKNP